MKVTHNKVGQNLNINDNAKVDSSRDKKVGAQSSPLATPMNGGSASKVDLSPRAQEAKRIKEIAMAAPDVDAEKVARFRQLIDEGKYKVDSRAVADKMVDEHLETQD